MLGAHKDLRPVASSDKRCPSDCYQGPLSPLLVIQVCPPGLPCVEGVKSIAVGDCGMATDKCYRQ